LTKEELIDIISIMQTADGGCSACVTSLLKELLEHFPEFALEIQEAIRASELNTWDLPGI
jgi:hypothetical protein